MNDQPENTSPQPDPKRETKEHPTPPLPALLKDQPNEPPPIPQGDDAMPIEPELHDVERRVRQLESHRAYTEERFTRHTQRLDGHDLRIDGLLSKEQITALITDTTKQLIEQAIRDQWQPITEAMDKFDTLTNDITRAFAGDQMKRNKFERFVRRNIREINQRDEHRQDEYRDFQERLGNWLIPVLGYNPHYPSDTRKPIVKPLVERTESIETRIIQTEVTLKELKDDKDARQDRERAAKEWRQKAIPGFARVIGQAASTPFVVNTALKILGGGALTTAILEFLAKASGAK